MFFLEPNETPYDLRWRMFGIPVRVHPMFWLVSAIMGYSTTTEGLQYLLIWIGCVFVSILIHELGHVWMGLAFGSHGHIVLYGFGGLAIGSNHLSQRWQRILVCFAGPLAGFLFLAILLALLYARNPQLFPGYLALSKSFLGLSPSDTELAALVQVLLLNRAELSAINDLIFINLLWGLVNLLPVWPLDGGQISRDVCEGLSPDRGLTVSLVISVGVAGLLAVQALLEANGTKWLPISVGGKYSALLFGLLAIQSFLLLQQAHSQQRWLDDHWRRHDW